MALNICPSAFQIRFGGCKGVIALDPSLGEDREILVIRDSMKKFESNSKSLEVLQVSRPGRYFSFPATVIWFVNSDAFFKFVT